MKKIILIAILISLFPLTVILAQEPGDTLWTKTYGGINSDAGYSVQQTSDNGYIVAGETSSFGAGACDAYLIKTNSLGDTIWTKTYGGSGPDRAFSVVVDQYGYYAVAGETEVDRVCDFFVLKVDATNGDTLWSKTYGGSGNDYGFSITIDQDGYYLVTGETSSFGVGSFDFWVLKINSANGDTIWTKTYGGSEYDYGRSIVVDQDGYYVVAGYTRSYGVGTAPNFWILKINPSNGDTLWTKAYGGTSGEYLLSVAVDNDGYYVAAGETMSYGAGNYDLWLLKINPATGDTIWTKTYGGSDNEGQFSIAIDQNGYYAVSGYSQSFGAGDRDAWLLKINPATGDTIWTKTYGGSNNEYSFSISVDQDGYYMVTGETNSFGAGATDVWLLKIEAGQTTGDFNSDGYVDAADLQLFGDHWHFISTDPGWDALYDLVPDNIIDAADLQVFGDHWHEGTPPKSGEGCKDGKGPNENAGIVFDLDATTYGNQNLTSIPSQPTGTYIRLDVYCTGVTNLDTYEFEVIYDATELAYISSSATNPLTFEPNILTTNGGTALGWMVDTSTPGVLSIAYTLAGNDPAQAPEGEGLIADIVFQALVNTHGTLSFGDVYYYDSYGVVDLITDTGTATLPVELSSFNAIYNTVSGFVSLCWATSSETDVNGFNIYRNTEDVFVEAEKINIDLIEGSGTTTETTEYSFIDETADPYYTTYYYWLEVINFGGTSDEFGPYKYIPIDVNQDGELGIIISALSPCYPNPSRIGNEIKFNFRVGGFEGTVRNVELKVYNILGKLVAEIVNGERLVNDYTETWNPEDLSNGVYFYQLKTENYNKVKKMVIQ